MPSVVNDFRIPNYPALTSGPPFQQPIVSGFQHFLYCQFWVSLLDIFFFLSLGVFDTSHDLLSIARLRRRVHNGYVSVTIWRLRHQNLRRVRHAGCVSSGGFQVDRDELGASWGSLLILQHPTNS